MAASTVLQPDSSGFFQQLARIRRGVLVLNYDDIINSPCLTPARCYFRPTLLEVLDSILTTTCTRVILLSTQPILELLRALGLQRHPEIWDPRELFVNDDSPEPGDRPVASRKGRLPAFLKLCAGSPVAWLVKCPGEPGQNHAPSPWGTLVRPEFYTQDSGVSWGAPDNLLHFLIDWLRACGGEVC